MTDRSSAQQLTDYIPFQFVTKPIGLLETVSSPYEHRHCPGSAKYSLHPVLRKSCQCILRSAELLFDLAKTRRLISLILLSREMDKCLAQHQLRTILQSFRQMHGPDLFTPR